MDSVESKLENVQHLMQEAKATKDAEKSQNVSLQDRLEMWDINLKELSRGIQLIRDKQVDLLVLCKARLPGFQRMELY